MRINSKGMFFVRANLGMQKVMNSLAAAPLSFFADPISVMNNVAVRDQFSDTVMNNVAVRDQKHNVYINSCNV